MHSGSLVASHTSKQKCLEGVWADSPIRRAVQIGQRRARKVGSAEGSRSSGFHLCDNWKLTFREHLPTYPVLQQIIF